MPGVEAGVSGPVGAPVLQSTGPEAGEPGARIPSPRLPPALNVIGIARPAFSLLVAGRLKIGG